MKGAIRPKIKIPDKKYHVYSPAIHIDALYNITANIINVAKL